MVTLHSSVAVENSFETTKEMKPSDTYYEYKNIILQLIDNSVSSRAHFFLWLLKNKGNLSMEKETQLKQKLA